jgi:hypothetical protein
MSLRVIIDLKADCSEHDIVGRDDKELIDTGLRQQHFTAEILNSALRVFTHKLKIAVQWIFWLGGI